MPDSCVACANQSARPARNLLASACGVHRGILLWQVALRQIHAKPRAALLLESCQRGYLARYAVPCGIAVRHPNRDQIVPRGTICVTTIESCAYSDFPETRSHSNWVGLN